MLSGRRIILPGAKPGRTALPQRRTQILLQLIAVVLLATIVVASPARASAQGADAAADPPVLERSLYKTVVFEGATNTIDLLLFGSLLGGHLYAGPAFLAVNATAAAVLYYGHEVAWGYLGPPDADYDVNTNILKGITFRLASSTRAFAVGYGFTGNPIAAGGFMVGSAVGETVVYVASEYGWEFYDQYRDQAATTRVKAIPAAWHGDRTSR